MLAGLSVIAITLSRVPAEAIDPVLAGPRYFFYPYIIFSRMGIWIAARSRMPVRFVLGAGYVFAVVTTGSGRSRRHDPVNWQGHIVACAQAERYEVPIHVAGDAKYMWIVKINGRAVPSTDQRKPSQDTGP